MPERENFVYLEIAETMRRLIVSGELSPGDRLPPVRELAESWKCTPNTVSRAYALLGREGLVSARRGGGTRVSSRTGPSGMLAPPEWQWADLVNRAESYLLEAISLGHSPGHAEAALAAAIARWDEVRSTRPAAQGQLTEAVPTPALRFAGSHDLSVELLARMLAEGTSPVTMTTEFIGSLGGLMAVARGEADIAGAHLWDEAAGLYNVPFVQRVLPNRAVVLLNLVKRLQGLIVAPGNPQHLAEVADLGRPDVSFVNRQPGSGTRVWLDVQLKRAGVDPERVTGYGQEETTHIGVARAVAEGRATAGLGIQAAASAYGLEFVRLGEERYDLVIPQEEWETQPVLALRSVVESAPFKQALLALGGYEVSETGEQTRLE
jgi:molybdate-binding protein/DNA-binding transcriptional regulator YhcF (GntR family)